MLEVYQICIQFMEGRRAAIIALLLVGAAPTISTICSFLLNDGISSQIIFVFTKMWLLCVPLIWFLKVDGGDLSWSKPQLGGYWMSIGLGLAMSVVMVLAWLLLGDAIDANLLSNALEPVGLLDPKVYFFATLYWILINSLLEEYVFRWFLVIKSEELVGEGIPAVLLSALIFVVHHTVALAIFGFPSVSYTHLRAHET